jgi:acetoin utilization protein AcuB
MAGQVATKEMLLIKEVMARPVIFVDMDATIGKMYELFQKHKFHHLPVVEEGELVGVISDRDILRQISPFIGTISEQLRDRNTLNKKAHQIMTRKPVTISENDSLLNAAKLMTTQRISCLPVIGETGKLTGMITLKDIVRAYVKMKEASM